MLADPLTEFSDHREELAAIPSKFLANSTMQRTGTIRPASVYRWACMILLASTLPTFPKEVSKPRAQKEVTQTLIIDGIWGSHKRWERLRSRIEKEVGPCAIWRYDNSGRVSIETLASALTSELKRINRPVNLVGYSMGGLVIREALRQKPDSRVQRIALLNSPNHGSAAAYLVPLSACREMRPGSPFLRQLNAAPWNYPTLVTWCPYDLMVFPGSSGRWEKANVLLRSDVPMHLWPVFSVEIHRFITAFLAAKDGTGAKSKRN
jgi:triacylglycerol lipase